MHAQALSPEDRRWVLHAVSLLEEHRRLPRTTLLAVRQLVLSDGRAWGLNEQADRLISRLMDEKPRHRPKRFGGGGKAHHLLEHELSEEIAE